MSWLPILQALTLDPAKSDSGAGLVLDTPRGAVRVPETKAAPVQSQFVIVYFFAYSTFRVKLYFLILWIISHETG